MTTKLQLTLHLITESTVQERRLQAVAASPPTSLALPPNEAGPDDEMAAVAGGNSPFRRLLRLMGYNSNEAIIIRGATRLYDAACTQADGRSLHDAVAMDATFFSRWCLISTHMWLVYNRLHAAGELLIVLLHCRAFDCSKRCALHGSHCRFSACQCEHHDACIATSRWRWTPRSSRAATVIPVMFGKPLLNNVLAFDHVLV